MYKLLFYSDPSKQPRAFNRFMLATAICVILLLICLIGVSQNVGINTTGAAPASTNMLEVLQPSTTDNTVGIYVNHSGATAGSSYALQAIKNGASLNNIAAYFSATGATNNYAGIFENGNVGIGTTSPDFKFVTSANIADWTAKIINTNAGAYGLSIENSSSSAGYALGVYTGAGTGMFVENTGEVGIGTTSPGYKLDVNGQIRAGTVNSPLAAFGAPDLIAGNSGSIYAIASNASITLDASGSAANNRVWSLSANNNNTFIGNIQNDAGTVGNNWLLVNRSGTTVTNVNFPNGNVGIGNTSPNQKLEVTGNARITSLASGASGAIVQTNTSGDFSVTNFSGSATDVLLGNGTFGAIPSGNGNYIQNQVAADQAAGFRINGNGLFNGGSVGIGTTSPGAKLHIKGSADATQMIVQGNAAQANTNPLIKLLNSAGVDVMWINSDNAFNTFVGVQAGRVNNQGGGGVDNTFIGRDAGYANTNGSDNTAIGMRALYANTLGLLNTAVGGFALSSNIGANGNTAVGYSSLGGNTTGANNTSIGNQSMIFNTSGNGNTAIGYRALYTQSYNPGFAWNSQNVAIGYEAMYSNQPTSTGTGYQNTAVGYQAMRANTTGYNNAALGILALTANTTGYYNTAMGNSTMGSNTTGYQNTAFGSAASLANTIAFNNTAIGNDAMRSNVSASENVALGNKALFTQSYNPGAWNSYNVAIGNEALYSNQPTSTGNGYLNTAVGYQAMRANTTGFQNTASGYQALYSNTAGYSNTAYGSGALSSNTTASQNIAIGVGALSSQGTFTNGGGFWNSYNIAIGSFALNSNQPTAANNGIFNVALGGFALYSNTTGNNNTAYGEEALYRNQTGSNNTAFGTQVGWGVFANSFSNNSLFGYRSGYGLSTGSNNVLLGYQSGDAITTGSNNIIIGYDIDAPVATGNQQLSIGNLIFGTGLNGTGTTISTGNVGIGTNSPDAKLKVAGVTAISTGFDGMGNTYSNRGVAGGSVEIGYDQTNNIGNLVSLTENVAWRPMNYQSQSHNFFFSGAATAGVVFNTSGNVGIGTTSPLLKLDVRGANAKATTAALENIFEVASTDASPLSLRMGIKTDATATSRYGAIEVDDAGTRRHLILQPTLTNTGYVGIGTTSPSQALHIKGGLPPGRQGAVLIEDIDPTGLAFLYVRNNVGGNLSLYKLASGYPSSNQYIAGAGLLEDDGAAGLELSSTGQDIRFYTAGNNIRMTIKNAGTIQLNGLTTNGIVRTTSGNGTLSSTGGNISLTSEVTGVLPLANGGSNANLTAVNGGAVYSTGTAMAITAAGTNGQVLTSNGAAAPTWQTTVGVPQNCPAGFTSVNAQYCIETDERAAATWWVANTTCVSAGAQLCSYGQWYSACALTGGLNNMTNYYEWVDDYTTSSQVRLVGNGSCDNLNYDVPSSSYAYRCCFNR